MVCKLRITFSQAVDGFMLEKQAQQRSRHTLGDYSNSFRHFAQYLEEDAYLDEITPQVIRRFLKYLGETPIAAAGAAPRPAAPLSKKSILNVHTALSSLWSWAVREGYAERHVVRQVPRPRPEKRAIVPYTRQDVKAMLGVCEESLPYTRAGQEGITHSRATGLRDEAIVRLLLDTGMRASELCRLTVGDVDLANQRAKVFGKGARERLLPFGRRTVKALWRYLVTRPDAAGEEPLFLAYGEEDVGMTRDGLRKLMARLARRAGVATKGNVHRFRHTFAVNFLRNGGDAYTLQMLLGHSTMDMVRRYLAIVQADVENVHKRASPVDNWRL